MPKIQIVQSEVSAPGGFLNVSAPSLPQTGVESLGKALGEVGQALGGFYTKSTAELRAAQDDRELQKYTDELENGSLGEDGKRIAAPDPLLRPKLFQEKADALRNKARQDLTDDRAYSLYEAKFASSYGREEINMKKAQIKRFDESIGANAELYVDNKADAFVTANDDLSKLDIRKDVKGSLDQYEAVYGSEKRAKLQERFGLQVARGSVFKMMRNNPDAAIASLARGEFNEDLKADEVQTLINQIIAYKKAHAEGPSDQAFLFDMHVAASTGQNVVGQLKQAVRSGRIKANEANSVLDDVEKNNAEIYAQNWYRRGMDQVDSVLKTEQYTRDPAVQVRHQKVRQSWMQWAREHPGATLEQADKEVQALIQEGRLFESEKLVIEQLRPRFLKGTVTNFDLGQTLKDTEAAYKKGEIDVKEYQRQLKQIDQWSKLPPPKKVEKTE